MPSCQSRSGVHPDIAVGVEHIDGAATLRDRSPRLVLVDLRAYRSPRARGPQVTGGAHWSWHAGTVVDDGRCFLATRGKSAVDRSGFDSPTPVVAAGRSGVREKLVERYCRRQSDSQMKLAVASTRLSTLPTTSGHKLAAWKVTSEIGLPAEFFRIDTLLNGTPAVVSKP